MFHCDQLVNREPKCVMTILNRTFGSGVGLGVNRRHTLCPLFLGGGPFLTVRLQSHCDRTKVEIAILLFPRSGEITENGITVERKVMMGRNWSRAGCWSVGVSTV